MQGLNIESDLHLCYLITPITEDVCRDWNRCCEVISSLQVTFHPSGRHLVLCQLATIFSLSSTGQFLCTKTNVDEIPEPVTSCL